VLGRRGAEEALEGVIVEVGAAGAVVEEPRLALVTRRLGHAPDEVERVGGPLVVERGEDGDGHLFDVLGLPSARGVDEALVEGEVLHPLRPLLAVDDLGEEVRVAPLGVHVRHRQEPVEVVESDVLGLGLDVLAHVPLPDGLGDVAGLGEQRGERHLALQAAGLAVHRGRSRPWRIGRRPVMSEAREGVQEGSE